ncbi:MAG: PKD domain-containing protein [Candidatus Omnitrophota bacterium]|nr:PKD domain-containing protein [Candidatus Omnitrophota bacterium]MBU1929737.1 PKD domain-containing protein [Candidatus Omnitrophota bacterium]MBU2035135.1 PKD domain-containing protein [Candidatus Omnitrophota bacterium]MBU2258669.1 PKD domain-containing protein [Candidatus Omnitrophota bacterium]
MKKILALLLFAFIFSGCATYKYQHGNKPYDQGYVITRNNQFVMEYTLGENNTVPDKELAKERFKRRRKAVEIFYKRMGYIESYYRLYFWNHVSTMADAIGGFFRMPGVAISEYRYAHNPKYREKIIKLEDEREAKEETRVNKIKDELREYVKKDLEREKGFPDKETKPRVKALVKKVKPAVSTGPIVEKKAGPRAGRIKPETIKAQSEVAPELPVAVIIAKPEKGYAPLMVNFSGKKSYSPKARIVSYSWDFGDSDTSNKPTAVNTYWSGSFETRYFNVILTVKDSNGNTAQANTTIEVKNK